jgi:two-component system phosphate regulon sensor histidine kinase PhoR
VSIRRSQLTAIALTTLLGSVLIVIAAGALLRASEREGVVARLLEETAFAAFWAQNLSPEQDTQELARQIAARLGVRVTLIAADGEVIGDSSKDRAGLQGMENHLEREEIRGARLGSRGLSRRKSVSTNVEYIYAAIRVPGDGRVRYVRLALPADELGHLPAAHTWLIVLLALAATLPVAIVGYLGVRRVSQPLDRLTAGLDRAVAEDTVEPLALWSGTDDEVTRVRASIRRLQLALLEKIDRLDNERTTLSSVIAGMREGLLLVDPDRRVRLANPALSKILDLSLDPQGHLLEEVVRHPAVIRDIDNAFARHATMQESVIQLPGSDRVFELHVTPLETRKRAGRHEVLALLVDVTRLDRLEKIRREFVANVSHELRTPLTSIKAFVENLLDGGLDDPENARKFLEIVRRHSDHMGELIEDLTDLSLIETGSISLELRRVDATEVVREVVEQLRPLADARDVAISVRLPSPFHVTADRRRLEQMLSNLITNAIKFNREGGQVVVAGETVPVSTLTVEDTGIGIPSNNLEKVFERFYRVSRDRSRAVGGTGLGLSIVKHLMRLHGGSVTLESELGHGSRFTLRFPPGETRGKLVALTGGAR